VANTGVPSPIVLTPYTGPCTITAANTVIDSKSIDNCDGLTIMAANVTIKNTKVNTHIWLDQDISGSSGWSMNVTDSDVDGGTSPTNWPNICCGMYTLTRVNSHNGQNGADCEFNNQYCTITDSYLHDPTQMPGDTHLGGFRAGGGTNLTLRHNTVWCNPAVNAQGGGCTGNINLLPFSGSPLNGALVQHNLLPAEVGGSYCTYGGGTQGTHITYDGNIFQRGSNGRCAVYGPVSNWNDANSPTNVWMTNNLWDDGTPVDPNA
jgi:hypothetical protein